MSYLRQLQMQKQLEEKAKEERKNRELSEKALKSAEDVIERAKKIDANTASVEAILEEAKASMASKDYKVGLDKAREAGEKAGKVFRERVKAIVDSSGTMVELARSVGEESSGGADYHDAALDALKKGEMEKAVELAKKSWKTTEKGLYEHLSNAFSQAQSLILTAKNADKDVSVPEDLLSRARSALEDNDYESAMGFTRDCLENVSAALKDDVSAALESAEGLLSLAKELDANVDKAEGILQRAKDEMDGLKFDKAMNSTKQALSDLGRLVNKGVEDGLATVRKELSVAEELGADVSAVPKGLSKAEEMIKAEDLHGAVATLRSVYEEVRQAKFRVVLQTIDRSKEKYQTALKIGADIGKAMDLLNKARESLNAGRFRDALEHANASDAEVDRLVKDFEDVEDRIRALKERFTFAEEVGLDISKSRSLLENAHLALQARNFGRVLDFIQKCEDATDKAEYEHTMQTVEAAEQAITLGEKMRLDLAEENSLLEDSIVATKRKEYSAAIKLAMTARSQTVERFEEELRSTISKFREAVPITGKTGVNAKKLFDKAESAFAAEDYEKAWGFASKGASLLESEVGDRTSRFLESIDLVKKLAASLDVGIPDLDEARGEAEEVAKDGSYEEMVQATERHRDRLGAALDAVFESLKSKVMEARSLKLDTGKMVARLKEAKIARGTDDFLKSLQSMTQAFADVKAALEGYQRAYDSMSSTAAMVAEAKKRGIDVSGVLRTLLEAKRLFEAGDMDLAYTTAEEAKRDTRSVMALYRAAQNITEARNSLEIAESLGFDAGAPQKGLQEAKDAMKERRYGEALELSAQAREEAAEFLGEGVARMVTAMEAMVAEAKDGGLPVGPVEASLNAARENLEAGSFGEAAEATTEAKDALERLHSMQDEAKKALKEAQAALAEVESMNVEAPRSTAIVERAEEAFGDHKYEEVIALGRRLLDDVEVERKAYVTQTIAKFEEAIAKAKAEGIKTQSAEGLLKESKKHLAAARYREALELAMQSENEVERVSLQQDMAAKALDTARKKIHGFEAPIPQAKEVLAQAEGAFEAGDYVKALELAIQSGDEFQRLAEAWDEAKESVERAEGIRKTAERIGAKTSHVEELMATARRALEEGEAERAMTQAQKAADRMMKATRQTVEGLLEEAKEQKRLCEALVIEVPGFNRSMAEAAALIEEGDLVNAYEVAVASRAAARDAVSSRAAEVFANSKAAVAHAKKMGADVSESVRILKESRDAMKAGDFELGVELAEKSVEVVESTRKREKDYIDLTYKADLSISSAKRFGIDVEAAEEKLLAAIESKGSDLPAAIGLAEEAVSLAKEAVEAFAPSIAAEVTVDDPQMGEWREATLVLRNLSKAVAKDVSVKIMGDAEVEEIAEVASVRGGGSHTMKFRIRMAAEGTVPLNIEVTSHRVMDGKEYTHQSLAEVPVGALEEEVAIPEEEAEEELVAREEAKCALCMGTIKTGMEMVRHSCGTLFHKPCGGRVKECPTCGQAT